MMTKEQGALMRSEAAESATKFATTVRQDLGGAVQALDPDSLTMLYTIARGSSDAAANVLSYEFMRELGLPMTTLPPSVFSLGAGVAMKHAAALILSQSGGSHDLLKSCQGIRAQGGKTIALTNTIESPLAGLADVAVDIGAGPELAIPATKSVICTIAAGMALLAALRPGYAGVCEKAAQAFLTADGKILPGFEELASALARAESVYVIGRGSGFGAAHELALKFKECAALHAEAYSASEVLHGPLQLVKKNLTVLILDTEEDIAQESLNTAEARFKKAGAPVFRLRPSDIDAGGVSPAAAAAILLFALYPVVREVSLRLGFDPDAPETLAKVTVTV